jgi:hypothetical protein
MALWLGWSTYSSHEKTKQRKTILTEDRLFSLSSVTSPASKREEFKKVLYLSYLTCRRE